MTKEPDTLNIPAFKRKRSIAAKAKKTEKITLKKPSKTRRSKREKLIEEIPIQTISPDIDLFEEETILKKSRKTSQIRKMKECGICDGFFEKIDVAIVQVISPLRIGDQIIFETEEGLFEQPVDSMQIDRKEVKIARSGSDVGLKVSFKPQVGGRVYKVI